MYNNSLNSAPIEINNNSKVQKIYKSIKQFYIFTKDECTFFEKNIDDIVNTAENGGYKNFTVDRTAFRNKYFFGEGYTYGAQLSQKGPGMERLYPEGAVDPIPSWITYGVIQPLIQANIIPNNFINSVVINDYKPGGCIVSHIDPPHIFDRPIITVSLLSDSCLSFGCKFDFKPIRCTEPIFKLALPKGIVTLLSGYSANDITHCIRPNDITERRAVIVLRRVLPEAPRLDNSNNTITYTNKTITIKKLEKLKIPKQLPVKIIFKLIKVHGTKIKLRNFGKITKHYRRRNNWKSSTV